MASPNGSVLFLARTEYSTELRIQSVWRFIFNNWQRCRYDLGLIQVNNSLEE